MTGSRSSGGAGADERGSGGADGAPPAGGLPRLPRLWVVTDLDRAPRAEWVARLERLARATTAGDLAVQLRDRDRTARERLAFGRELRALTGAEGHWLAVNDRVDLALALEADALHLGETALATHDARRLWGARPLLRAVHGTAPRAAGADAVVLSPVFAPRKGNAPLSLSGLAAVCRLLAPTPVIALGGVDAGNAASCLEAGAAGVAVQGAALEGEDPAGLAAVLGLSR